MDSLDNVRERFAPMEQQTERLQQPTRMVERWRRWWCTPARGSSGGPRARPGMPLHRPGEDLSLSRWGRSVSDRRHQCRQCERAEEHDSLGGGHLFLTAVDNVPPPGLGLGA